jgi:hypothetical protein
VEDRYTGREFIVTNYSVKDLLESDPILKSARIVTFPPGAQDSSGGCTKYGGKWVNDATYKCLFTAEKSYYNFLTEGYGFWD